MAARLRTTPQNATRSMPPCVATRSMPPCLATRRASL